jgi:hypothetical protein
MDSFTMPNEDGRVAVARLRFRWVRLNQLTLDVGDMVIVCARSIEGGNAPRFPAQLEWSVDGRVWQAVPFVNASLVDDEDVTPK